VARGGSRGILTGIVAGFLILFALQRCWSPFLRIEADPALAAAVAADAGVSPVDVMALRDLFGADLDRAELTARCRDFTRLRGSYGEGLAAVASCGHETLVSEAVSSAGGDAGAAWETFRQRPEAACGVRFLQVRARFAERLGFR
jgi:hypothetical protein